MKKNLLSMFIEKLLAYPLWVKQVIYLRLYQNLSEFLTENIINDDESKIFHTFKPSLTFLGKSQIGERSGNLNPNIYLMLEDINEDMNVIEIALNRFWTMEEISNYFIIAAEQNFIKGPIPTDVISMAKFIAGQYRIGEYYKHTEKIDVYQLQQAIVKQKELAKEGTNILIAELMISMGFITEKDIKALMTIKEESKKRFILDNTALPAGQSVGPANPDLSAEVETLRAQNTELKRKLAQLLTFVKRNSNAK